MSRIKAIQEKIGEKRQEMDTVHAACEKEARSRTEEEKTSWDSAKEEIRSLEVELKDLQEYEDDLAKRADFKSAASVAGDTNTDKTVSSEERDILKISKNLSGGRIAKILAGQARMDGVEREVTEEAQNEARMGGANFGYKGVGIPGSVFRAEWNAAEKRTDIDQATSAIKPTVVGSYVESIRQEGIFTKVVPGSNILTGLTGDYKIPVVGSQSLAWATAENSAAADGGANFTSDTMTPTRLTGYADVSNRVILQNGDVAMQAVMSDFGRETANKIDAAMFSTANVSDAPTAIAATSGVLTFTEAGTYAASSATVNGTVYDDYLAALQKLANGNSANGALAFVGHSKLLSDLVKSPQVLGTTAAATNFQVGAPLSINMNGIQFHLTTSNTSNGTTSADFIGGNFNFQYVGFFGGFDMSLDPYSVKLNDEIRIVIHRHLDTSTTRGAAFVKSTTLLS
tara:strand:- start:6101 stop:7468 length:1368 start_codon:yes stop_codon:yes gene_type:complete